nr:MFS transporter [uncultured Mediterraneibacter sp.]
MKQTYNRTLIACYTGYVVQAVVNNFAPLLFLTFQNTYNISMSRITLLITANFIIQLITDCLSAGFIDRIGYRASLMIAHAASAAGLICLPLLPGLMPDPFIGLLIAVGIYAIGGGLLEVMVSPVVEALPTKNKEKTMSMLHSFYCWGHVGVVLISTIFFTFFGVNNWKIMAVLWALIPLYNFFVFRKVPLCPLIEEGEEGMSSSELIQKPAFWILMIVMVCAGASEQSVSQWASTFAEQGLGVSKTIGDLAGPMFFAVCMGGSRLLYGLYGERLNLKKAMILSGVLCVFAYGMISLSPAPALSLLGCGICGFSVGIMWPGAFSIGASVLKGGGTAMFAFFALAGDLGCSGGPTYVGMISEHAGGSLKMGIQWAVIFPLLLMTGVILIRTRRES